MAPPFLRRRVRFSSSPIRLELGDVDALEFEGALLPGLWLYFVHPGEDNAHRHRIELLHPRVIPCVEATSVWIVWPTDGTGDLEPWADFVLWRGVGHVNVGSELHTYNGGHLVDFLEANRNVTLPTSIGVTYELHEQVNADWNKGQVAIVARRFALWATDNNPFRLLLYSRDFAGGYRLTRQWESSVMADGGSALEVLEDAPPLGWRLNAYAHTGPPGNKFTFTVATTA